MIEVLHESHGNVLGIKALGKLTDEDYKTVLIPAINKILAEHAKARVLFSMGDEFHGWERSKFDQPRWSSPLRAW